MTKHILLSLFLIVSLTVVGQSNLTLQINHHLSGVDFEYGIASENNIGKEFSLDRLEYYISEITIVHDGGMETSILDHYILVNASSVTMDDLGSFSITNVERVRFSIGVDPDHNHLDPASYASGHPLAPQSPAMHWGWAAGYRFVAMEGFAGSSLSQIFEIHALGDDYYYEIDQEVTAEASSGDLLIPIYADYTKALDDIDVSTGLIVHGDFGEATVLLGNYRDNVFSGIAPTPPTPSGIAELNFQNIIQLYPNPAAQGNINLTIANKVVPSNTSLVVTDLSNRELYRYELPAGSNSHQFHIAQKGSAIVSLYIDGIPQARKLVVVE